MSDSIYPITGISFFRKRRAIDSALDPGMSTCNDLLLTGIVPDDIYTDTRYYKYGGRSYDESERVIKAFKDKPDKKVTIYRAVPEHVTKIEDGNWITLSPTYAKEHMGGEEGWHIITKKVPAKHVIWDGNDLNEFAYYSKARY